MRSYQCIQILSINNFCKIFLRTVIFRFSLMLYKLDKPNEMGYDMCSYFSLQVWNINQKSFVDCRHINNFSHFWTIIQPCQQVNTFLQCLFFVDDKTLMSNFWLTIKVGFSFQVTFFLDFYISIKRFFFLLRIFGVIMGWLFYIKTYKV